MSKENPMLLTCEGPEAPQPTDKTTDEKTYVSPLPNQSKKSDEEEHATGTLTNAGITRKITKITNEHILEYLCSYPFYHGYLLHEYQRMLLTSYGEFVMRLSLRHRSKGTKRKTNREKGVDVNTRVSVIIGVNIKDTETPAPKTMEQNTPRTVYADYLDDNKTKNDIIDLPLTIEQTPEGKWSIFYIDKKKKFASIDELVTFYKTNAGTWKDKKYNLIRGVQLFPWELDRSHLRVGTRLLGEGAFGEVRDGVLKHSEATEGTQVAIKSLKSEDSKDCIKEMMHEARLQLCMRNKHVLRTIGICILRTPLFIVTEFCKHGALREYLKQNKCNAEDKTKFAMGSAKGVEYIHSKTLIHRDLATRNVLLTETNVPKIADFGMARYGTEYKMTSNSKIPIRYLAPETLTGFRFSQRSDVYSFGLLVWEIFENGVEPYTKPQPHQEVVVPKGAPLKAVHLKEIIKRELWVKFNADTPPQVQQFVTERIFVTDEKKRPPMSEVYLALRSIYKGISTKSREQGPITG